MKKNILIIGPPRSGKTSLAKLLNEEFKYSVISIDNLIGPIHDVWPQLEINHNGDNSVVAQKLAPFLIKYLEGLQHGFVVEGTYVDFKDFLPTVDRSKYIIIGLVYNELSNETLYSNIRKYDTESDWTYYCNDQVLKDNIRYFIERNDIFNEKYYEHNIKVFDVSNDRNNIFNQIMSYIICENNN